MLNFNITGNRYLREGDRVKIARGNRIGCFAQVVGFDLLETETPIVVQYGAASGSGRELVGANDVEYDGNFGEAPEALEPLPEIRTILVEGKFSGEYQTCGKLLCMKLLEDGVTISFVPKDDSVRLVEVFESKSSNIVEAVEELLKIAFVTRRPHLVEISRSKEIWQLLGTVSSEEAIKQLTA